MKDLFPGYYRPTPEEFDELWKKATFVFDANVLLHIHRKNKPLRRAILDKIKDLGERLWIPYEIAAEYQRNKLKVARSLVDNCKDILDGLKKAKDPLRARSLREHPILDVDGLTKGLDQLIQQVEKARDASGRVSLDDDESIELAFLLQGRIDEPYSDESRSSMLKDAKARAEKKIPPGFKDFETKKDEALAGGDALIWFKLVRRAKEKQCPIIFVTEDAKEDWWWGDEEQAHGPHPELRQEMWKEAQQRFYMYKLSSFLEHAGRYLGEKVPADVVRDVKAHEQEQKALAEARLAEAARLSKRCRDLHISVVQMDATKKNLAATLETLEKIAPRYDGEDLDFLRGRIAKTRQDIRAVDDALNKARVELDDLTSQLITMAAPPAR